MQFPLTGFTRQHPKRFGDPIPGRKSKQIRTELHKDISTPKLLRPERKRPLQEDIHVPLRKKRSLEEYGAFEMQKRRKVDVDPIPPVAHRVDPLDTSKHRFVAARNRKVEREQFQKDFMQKKYTEYRSKLKTPHKSNPKTTEPDISKTQSSGSSKRETSEEMYATPTKKPSKPTTPLRRSTRKAARKAKDSIKKQSTPRISKKTPDSIDTRMQKRTEAYRLQQAKDTMDKSSKVKISEFVLPILKKRARKCRGSPVAVLREFYPECDLPLHPSKKLIQKALRKALAKFHPDSLKGKQELVKVVEFEEIYKLLSDIRDKV